MTDPTAPIPAPETWIELVPLGDLVPAPRNPKAHDLATIDASLQRFGYVEPIVRNEATGHLVAGHGRLETLALARDTGRPPPKRIVPTDDDWLVPILRGISFDSDAEAEAYLLTSNQSTIGSGWDPAALAEVLGDYREPEALWGTGFDEQAVADLLLAFGPAESVDEMLARNGESRPDDFWPVLRVQLPPDLMARWRTLMAHCPETEAVDQVRWLLDLAEAAAGG
ncbi:MAG: hypothetical protein LC798_07490 [Chloroflexi bacterium]|nr:hypothetical protein [Chloroflexota bacterium]